MIIKKRYWYDEETDDLSIVIYGRSNYGISLGGCKEKVERGLQDLIREYQQTTFDNYEKENEEVSKLFDEKKKSFDRIHEEIGDSYEFMDSKYRNDVFESDPELSRFTTTKLLG